MSNKPAKLYGRSKVVVILMGIALTILGIAMFVHPIKATLLIVYTVGWTLVVSGAVASVFAALRHKQEGWQADLAVGLLQLVPGLVIVCMPGMFSAVVFELIGVIIVVNGINDIADAVIASRLRLPGVGLRVALGALTILGGFCVVASPFLFAEFVMVVAGVSLVFDGVTEVFAGIKM